ncbi:MAG: FAD-dependent oxidoreductase [Bacteroidaceae bacterium]|nr:FAD-dependent oxidoreductase [Bacteroidaceae bacterium]
MKVVIVGGVAGGATAAARIRRLDEQAEIVVFERSGFVSYANCGLPYYVGGVIEDAEDLTLQTPEGFYTRFRVRVKVRHNCVYITKTTPEKICFASIFVIKLVNRLLYVYGFTVYQDSFICERTCWAVGNCITYCAEPFCTKPHCVEYDILTIDATNLRCP